MPNILLLSLVGESFFKHQRYKNLLPQLLSSANIHESLHVDDAVSYVSSGFPSIILVTDALITYRQFQDLARRLVRWVSNGGTMILMGNFAADVEWPDLNSFLQLIHKDSLKPWAMAAYSKEHIKLNKKMAKIRTGTLGPKACIKGTFLRNVDQSEIIYSTGSGDACLCSTAFGSVNHGWLGYIGDMNFGEDAEKTIIAMCRLDQPETRNEDVEEHTYNSYL